jgi:hypothetical protein
MEQMRNAYNVLVGEPERRRSLVRLRCKWEGNIKMDLRETWLKVWTGFIWLGTGTRGGLLLTR